MDPACRDEIAPVMVKTEVITILSSRPTRFGPAALLPVAA
jgi:hypothetical protein